MSLHLQHIRVWRLLHAVEFVIVVLCCDAAADKTPLCLVMKSDNASFQVSFVTHQPDSSSLRFHWSRWTSERHVTDCFTSTDATLIAQYLSLCDRRERARNAAEKLLHFDSSLILKDDESCECKTSLLSSLSLQHVQHVDSSVKRRQKRAFFLLPGTLWCGRGSSADSYEQLGMFENADRCCREHDHCEHIIRAFSVNFGVFNPTLFTISHCDCDHRFRQCLLAGNDTISNMVGYSFFNVLKMRCFELSQTKRCILFNWFGMCTSVQIAPVAIMKDSTPYNSSHLHNESNDITDLSCNEKPIKSSHNNKQRSSKSKQMRFHKGQKDCSSVKHTKQDTFQLSQKWVKTYDKKKKIQTAEPPKGRKTLRSKSPVTFTPSPQPYTSIMKRRKKLKSLHQGNERTSKANITSSPLSVSETKSLQKTPTPVTKSRFQRKKNNEKTLSRGAVKSRKSTKKSFKAKKSYDHFNPSRGNHYQKKHHKGTNILTSKRRDALIQSVAQSYLSLSAEETVL